MYASSSPPLLASGVHRSCTPEETLARINDAVRWAGVSRLAEVTQLDRLGLPIYQAIRPQARLLSMTQGKGLDDISSKVSALMEAIECAHGEQISPGDTILASQDIPESERLSTIDFPDFDPALPRPWLAATNLLTDASLMVPFHLVSLDYTVPRPMDITADTNGLAAGNTLMEACVAALCEVIERDGCAQWRDGRARNRIATRIDPASIADSRIQTLIAKISAAGCSLILWDLTTVLGVPVMQAEISESQTLHDALAPAYGSGCHPCKEVALLRAITEAAQTRIVVISGAREDIGNVRYGDPRKLGTALNFFHFGFADGDRRNWADIATHVSASSEDDFAFLLDVLRTHRITQVAAVDLTRAEIGIPVVRIIIPGFGEYERRSLWQGALG